MAVEACGPELGLGFFAQDIDVLELRAQGLGFVKGLGFIKGLGV